MSQLRIDFGTVTGAIKPLHGVNNGPVTENFVYDTRVFFKDAGIPFSRLHDTEYPFGRGEFVDIPCIFPNFRRDPEDPTAYNFAFTDSYLQYIQETGAEIIYRLGCSIEHQPVKRYVYPPKDYKKWISVCEHIIRHYNEGWADGYHMNIKYWEIWNEPDGKLWLGTEEEFFLLYKMAVMHLKKCFPDLYFGGPALCLGRNTFAEHMMEYMTRDGERVPFDFYSWHTYADSPEKFREQAQAAQKLLDEYGYTETKSILDEWNYVETWDNMGPAYDTIQSMKGAAFNAAVLSTLQDTTCDIATYYDGQFCFLNSWNGLFGLGKQDIFYEGFAAVEAKKGYYPFKAFGKLYRLGNQVKVEHDSDFLKVTAATDGKQHAIILSNFQKEGNETTHLTLNFEHAGETESRLYLLDENHDLELVKTFAEVPEQLEIPANTVFLWEF